MCGRDSLVSGRPAPFWLVRAHVAQAAALSAPVEFEVI
jgi:hypothetical protein